MTALLGIEHPRGVVVGTDSRITGAGEHWNEDAPKWVQIGSALVALAGGVRLSLLAEAIGAVRAPRRTERPQAYLSLVVADAIRVAVEAVDGAHDCEGVIAYRGCAYYLAGDYAVIRPAGGIVAAGGGGVAARAAALALADVEPVERVKRALAIAAQVCPGVGEPMHVRDVRRR